MPDNNLHPTIICYHGETYWLIDCNIDGFTLQHAESGGLHTIYLEDPAYDNIVSQIESQRIFQAIRRERQYQDRKYGMIHERNLLLDNYLGICRGELTEAWDALADGKRDEALLELLQVAAVAVAALEAHGLVVRSENKEQPHG
jgi:NTP pyrophosphatase (non-canonical NTP hydrolase)